MATVQTKLLFNKINIWQYMTY